METDIDCNSFLTLKGATAGDDHLAGHQFIIQLTGCSFTSRGRAATILLPLPKQILELLCGEDENGLVAITNPPLGIGAIAGPTMPRRVASILVLVYDYANENELFLKNHDWEPCSTGGAISLHIISTSITPEGYDHITDTEQALRNVIQNYPGLIFRRPPAHRQPNWDETNSPLYGDLQGRITFGEFIVTATREFAFAQAELEGIPPRTVRIGRLGRMKQQGRPIGGLWQEPDPLHANPCDCGHLYLQGH